MNKKISIQEEALIGVVLVKSSEIFHFLKKRKKIDVAIENDFSIFHEVANECIKKYGSDFSFQLVYKKLPQNKWIPIFIKALHALNRNNPENFTPIKEVRSSLLETNSFKEACQLIKNMRDNDFSSVQ